MKAALPQWVADGNDLVLAYRARYQEILTDLNALDYEGVETDGFRVDDVANEALSRLDEIGGSSSEFESSQQALIDSAESNVQIFTERRTTQARVAADAAARNEELVQTIEDAIGAYRAAHAGVTNLLQTLPAYATEGVTLWGGNAVVGDEALIRTNLADSANPSGLLRTYCSELSEIYAQLLACEDRKANARKLISTYAGDCYQAGIDLLAHGYVDLDILPTACDDARAILVALVQDFNLCEREGRLMEYYALLADNRDYYALSMDVDGGASLQAVNLASGETLPTYDAIVDGIATARNLSGVLAGEIDGYSPCVAGDLYETELVPLMEAIEAEREDADENDERSSSRTRRSILNSSNMRPT